MYREFFNAFPLVERRDRVERRRDYPCVPFRRRLLELSVPGPPGMADHAMQALAPDDARRLRRR